jgi:signal peptidase
MPAEATPSADRSKVALLGEVVQRFGEARVRVTGSSMLPSVWPGDVLTVRRRLVSQIQAGQIAVFARGGRLVAHRVVARTERHLVTRGDSVPSPDPPVSEGELLGVVASISHDGRSERAPSAPGVASRLVAALTRRSSGASRVLQRIGSVMPPISKREI